MTEKDGKDKTTGASPAQHDDLMKKMEDARKKWSEDDGEKDDTDRLLDEAIGLAIHQGKGWSAGEKEAYMSKILDDDFIPPIFAETAEEVEKSGLAEAFSTLQYDDSPAVVMLEFKQKGTDAFVNGKRNEAKNMQYFRDAVNHYYEAFVWAQRIEPLEQMEQHQKASEERKTATEDHVYTEAQLDEIKATLYANAALAHLQLKNWGHVRDDSKKAIVFNKHNVKAWYRLAKAYQMLNQWEEAGDAIDSGLACPGEEGNKDLLKLQKLLAERVRRARLARQQRERKRAERVSRVKMVWKHCKANKIQLGRITLVASVTDEEDDEAGDDREESRWHHHHPHTGQLPESSGSGEWSWPCMFVYPSHSQSDFVKNFGESEMLALRMAQMFPELEDGQTETAIPWDYNNEFSCSSLAVYFEVHGTEEPGTAVHPDSVERLKDQGSTMRFYEAARALRGDEGVEMSNLVRAMERKRLHQQRKAWKKRHGSLWAQPGPLDVVRVHPAMTLRDVLVDARMLVPNFLVTFVVIPENHPVHQVYLKEHKCVGVIQPEMS